MAFAHSTCLKNLFNDHKCATPMNERYKQERYKILVNLISSA